MKLAMRLPNGGVKATVWLLAAIVLLAPGVDALDLAVGAKTGIDVGWFSGQWPAEGDNQARAGMSISAFAEFALMRRFSLQPEVGLSGRRGGADDGTRVTVKTTALDVALLAKPHTPFGPGTVYALAGPQLIFLLGDVTTDRQDSGSTVSTTHSPDEFVLYGATVGFGYAISAGPGELFADLSYSRAFNSFDNNLDTYMNSAAFKLGILIPLMSSGLP